jgi:hypothetical protein
MEAFPNLPRSPFGASALWAVRSPGIVAASKRHRHQANNLNFTTGGIVLPVFVALIDPK